MSPWRRRRTTWALGIVGAPVGHSLSPALHGAGLASLGLLGAYTAYEAPDRAALASLVARLRAGELHGLNVTIPWKVEAVDLCDALSDEAAALGAVNTLVREPDGRVVGHNTDVHGLRMAVSACGEGPSEVVAVIGAGGAARAALQVAADLGAAEVRIWNRTPERAEATLEALRERSPAWRGGGPRLEICRGLAEAVEGAQLVVQASAWGLASAGQSPQEDLHEILGAMTPDGRLVDLVYAPWGAPSRVTPWVAAAQASGRRAVDGLPMLVHQAALAFWLWTGQHPALEALWRAAGVSRSAG